MSQDYQIKSYPQIWLDKECSIQNRLISSDEQETVSLINHNLISLLNASKYETVNDIVDGVIIWECSQSGRCCIDGDQCAGRMVEAMRRGKGTSWPRPSLAVW
ncbi:hypothetical protein [Nitrosomonas sp. Nm34]|uniref:hypothetical protein n=1 Tax=Nitrosomonas sp. Nm34 TaxID=1881055 RepID=UPI000B87ACAB|nr:hypothetical protein [Nitrosomonas sp. Nm34]